VKTLPAIKLEDVCFDYHRVGNRKQSLKNLMSLRNESFYLKKRVISDVNLQIQSGENVGLIGKNGSGKSTLLRIMAGLYPPFEGRVQVNGRISPLMDLGAGFHPELSAKDNVRLNSHLLGNINPEIPEILEWANLSGESNNPIRTFSSGMIARLAFSIATSINPEILLVDEVLSVGDEDFRKKSLKRMRDLMASDCTVVLVSHDLKLLETECSRIVWLEKGEIVMQGEPKKVLSGYLGD